MISATPIPLPMKKCGGLPWFDELDKTSLSQNMKNCVEGYAVCPDTDTLPIQYDLGDEEKNFQIMVFPCDSSTDAGCTNAISPNALGIVMGLVDPSVEVSSKTTPFKIDWDASQSVKMNENMTKTETLFVKTLNVETDWGKIFEKLIYTRLYGFLADENIIYENQYGFRKGHSTSHALNYSVNYTETHVKNKKHVLGIFID